MWYTRRAAQGFLLIQLLNMIIIFYCRKTLLFRISHLWGLDRRRSHPGGQNESGPIVGGRRAATAPGGQREVCDPYLISAKGVWGRRGNSGKKVGTCHV